MIWSRCQARDAKQRQASISPRPSRWRRFWGPGWAWTSVFTSGCQGNETPTHHPRQRKRPMHVWLGMWLPAILVDSQGMTQRGPASQESREKIAYFVPICIPNTRRHSQIRHPARRLPLRSRLKRHLSATTAGSKLRLVCRKRRDRQREA